VAVCDKLGGCKVTHPVILVVVDVPRYCLRVALAFPVWPSVSDRNAVDILGLVPRRLQRRYQKWTTNWVPRSDIIVAGKPSLQ